MTVLLAHLPAGFEEDYPLALATIAAQLKSQDIPVDGLDVGRVGLDGLIQRLNQGDVGLVGLYLWSPAGNARFVVDQAAIDQANAVIAEVRAFSRPPYIAVSGPYATLCPERVDADAVIVSSPVATFGELAECIATGRDFSSVAGLSAQPKRPQRAARDCPLPDRELFPVAEYHRDHLPRGRRYTSVTTSHGCNHQCTYCPAPRLFNGFNARPVEQVVEEWRRLYTLYGVDGLLVEDDLFTQDRGRVLSLCRALIDKPIGVTWELLNGVRPEQLDHDLLSAMAQAKCTRLALSLESANPSVLENLGRSPDLSHVYTVVESARKNNISTTGYFMLGLPGESPQDRQKTFDMAVELGLDMAHFTQASAWPGCSWDETSLVEVSAAERAAYYARFYLHPGRARRVAQVLGVGISQIPEMVGRLKRWMTQPIESRRSTI
jgi:radical SAM superfamily enzyme YgiQ (UPF0313 family)